MNLDDGTFPYNKYAAAADETTTINSLDNLTAKSTIKDINGNTDSSATKTKLILGKKQA